MIRISLFLFLAAAIYFGLPITENQKLIALVVLGFIFIIYYLGKGVHYIKETCQTMIGDDDEEEEDYIDDDPHPPGAEKIPGEEKETEIEVKGIDEIKEEKKEEESVLSGKAA